MEGVTRITTETGAGQWGSALSFACRHFDIKCVVYMVKISYEQKPYRKLMMNTWGADVYAWPHLYPSQDPRRWLALSRGRCVVSQLLKDKLIEAEAVDQLECFEAGVLFSQTEGIIPAPEANHGIASAIREANKAKEEGISRTILFNLCGHGHFDMAAYEAYFAGNLQRHELTQSEIDEAVSKINTPAIPA